MHPPESIDLRLVEQLSTGPVTPDSLGRRLYEAATALFPATAFALTRTETDSAGVLLALVTDQGEVVVATPARLERDDGDKVGMATGDGRLCWLEHDSLPDFDHPQFHDYRSCLVIPLPLGESWSLAALLFSREAAVDDPALEHKALAFSMVANNLMRRVERVRLIQANAWIESELDRLGELQNLLRPVDLDTFKGVSIAVESRSHRYAGGDYYDVSRLAEPGPDAEVLEICAFGIADVSGHGPSAATEAAMLDTVMRTYGASMARHEQPGPASVMTYLNEHMFSRRPRPTFATVFLGGWNPAMRTMRYASAGHLPPIVKRVAGNVCAPLDTGDDIPIHVLRQFTWTEREARFEPGDILVLYTDGITEARAPDDAQFGLQRLIESVGAAPFDAAGLCSSVMAAVDVHAAGRPNADDQTLLVIEFE